MWTDRYMIASLITAGYCRSPIPLIVSVPSIVVAADHPVADVPVHHPTDHRPRLILRRSLGVDDATNAPLSGIDPYKCGREATSPGIRMRGIPKALPCTPHAELAPTGLQAERVSSAPRMQQSDRPLY